MESANDSISFTWKWPILYSALIVTMACTIFMLAADRPFVMDQLDFPIVADATAKTGVPLYYRGGTELNLVPGNYHPTLYIHTLATWIKLVGFSELKVRIFGFLCLLGASAIATKLLFVVRPNANPWTVPLFLALFLLNPYVLANASIPDIDQAILPIVINAFLLVLALLCYCDLKIFYEPLKKNIPFYLLSLCFIIGLWTKLTTTLLFPFVMFLALLVKGVSIRQTFKICLAIIVFSVTLFLASYLGYCLIYGLNPRFTFGFIVDSLLKGFSTSKVSQTSLFENIKYMPYLLLWLSFPFVAMWGYGILAQVIQTIQVFKKRSENACEFRLELIFLGYLLFCTGVCLAYSIVSAPFVGFFKYAYPTLALPTLSMAMAATYLFGAFPENFSKYKKLSPHIMITLVICLLVAFQIKFFGDTTYISMYLEKGFIDNYAYLNFFFVGLVSALVIAIWFLQIAKKSINLKESFGIIGIWLFISTVSVSLSIAFVQATSNMDSHTYSYGLKGFTKTVDFLKKVTLPGEFIWASKDIGHYSTGKYIENYSFFSKNQSERLNELLKDGSIRFFVVTYTGVTTDRIAYVPYIWDAMKNLAVPVANFGDFVVFQSKQTLPQ